MDKKRQHVCSVCGKLSQSGMISAEGLAFCSKECKTTHADKKKKPGTSCCAH